MTSDTEYKVKYLQAAIRLLQSMIDNTGEDKVADLLDLVVLYRVKSNDPHNEDGTVTGILTRHDNDVEIAVSVAGILNDHLSNSSNKQDVIVLNS